MFQAIGRLLQKGRAHLQRGNGGDEGTLREHRVCLRVFCFLPAKKDENELENIVPKKRDRTQTSPSKPNLNKDYNIAQEKQSSSRQEHEESIHTNNINI